MIDYKRYNLTQEQASAVNSLTDNQLEYAYRLRQHQYHISDAQQHAQDMFEDTPDILTKFNNEIYDQLATRFENKHDCDLDDNAQWDAIIQDYAAEHLR